MVHIVQIIHAANKPHVPWFFSFRRRRVAGINISIRSGTFRKIRTAHNADCVYTDSQHTPSVSQ